MPKKEKLGRVVSTKLDKSIVVEVAEYRPHPKYKKIIAQTKNYMVHDQNGIGSEGDDVRIVEARPTSKNKKWNVVEVVTKATK